MGRSIYNAKHYRRENTIVGMRVTTEKYEWYTNAPYKDINGDSVIPYGTCEVWGKVISINNNYHCSVWCDELHFTKIKTIEDGVYKIVDKDIIIPIKEERRYSTAINFWRGGVDVEEENLDDIEYNDIDNYEPTKEDLENIQKEIKYV